MLVISGTIHFILFLLVCLVNLIDGVNKVVVAVVVVNVKLKSMGEKKSTRGKSKQGLGSIVYHVFLSLLGHGEWSVG